MRVILALVLAALAGMAAGAPVTCADGSTRIMASTCPGGMVVTYATKKTSGDGHKRFKCADGSERFDQANCPGGLALDHPHVITGSQLAHTAEAAAQKQANKQPETAGGEPRFAQGAAVNAKPVSPAIQRLRALKAVGATMLRAELTSRQRNCRPLPVLRRFPSSCEERRSETGMRACRTQQGTAWGCVSKLATASSSTMHCVNRLLGGHSPNRDKQRPMELALKTPATGQTREPAKHTNWADRTGPSQTGSARQQTRTRESVDEAQTRVLHAQSIGQPHTEAHWPRKQAVRPRVDREPTNMKQGAVWQRMRSRQAGFEQDSEIHSQG